MIHAYVYIYIYADIVGAVNTAGANGFHWPDQVSCGMGRDVCLVQPAAAFSASAQRAQTSPVALDGCPGGPREPKELEHGFPKVRSEVLVA